MKHKQLKFQPLDMPNMLTTALELPATGRLAVSINNLTFLDVDDNYIYRLFPFLKAYHHEIEMPDYFGPGLIGAHISLIYPEENCTLNEIDLDQEHHFKINGIYTVIIGLKKYYVLGIEAPSLLALRRQYGLPEKLAFKEYCIDLHITIGVWLLDPFQSKAGI